MISAVDNNIIWGMSGACLGQHLGHIVNNGQQSAVLHASMMPFFLMGFNSIPQHFPFMFNLITLLLGTTGKFLLGKSDL